MLVTKRLNNFGIRHPGSVVALGSFDGIHLGHRAIIKKLVSQARAAGHDSVVVTFDPHPQQVLSKEKKPYLLTTVEEKQEILESLGVGVMAVIKFSRLVAKMQPEDFIRSVLLKKLKASEIICGLDCGFGAGRQGDIKTLKDLGGKMGFRVTELPSLRSGVNKISSSVIRELVFSGKMERAGMMLGRQYSIRGRVTRGLGLGRKFGFPTANIAISDKFKLLPRDGVYAAKARIGSMKYEGMLFIGQRSTLGLKGRTIEFNAFGGRYGFAGKRAEIFPLRYIRPGRKYSSVEELVKAIKRDEIYIKKYIHEG